MDLNVDELKAFPKKNWEEEPTERWLSLCNQLQSFHPTIENSLVVTRPERKWELVSAYQKSVRRGLSERACWLVTGFISFEKKEYAYFWKRICTTSTEDIGYGDVELMNFVIACSTVFKPSTTYETLQRVWVFLTQQMCSAQKSRIFCQLSIIENCIKKDEIPAGLDAWETSVVEYLKTPLESISPQHVWARKNDWRGEGMLKYQGNFPLKLEEGIHTFADTHEILSGLPSYCYDMHTRVGKATIIRMTGLNKIKELFTASMESGVKAGAIGYALFFAEGGLIQGGLVDPRLSELENKFVAKKFNLPFKIWMQLVEVVREYVAAGKVNQIRSSVLEKQGY